tara:strand:- start:385 stop:867 length:483 start_codon:yes stop_codon:yes gene_type:complete
MRNNNIGLQVDINDYLSNNITHNTTRKYTKYKVAEAAAGGGFMHYLGIGMLSGVFISSVVSGINGVHSVKKDCDKIQELGEDVSDITKFMLTEVTKRKVIADVISGEDKSFRRSIGNIQKKIEEEEERQKNAYKFTQIVNLIVISSFIILIVAKVIIQRI